jgi:hypothetical protein
MPERIAPYGFVLRLFHRLPLLGPLRGPSPRAGRGKSRAGWWFDAEHVAEGVEEAVGLGGGGEEGLEVRVGGEEVGELAAAAGGVVADDGDEPGAGGGVALALAWGVGAAGTGGAGPGQGAGLPVGEQFREALGDAADAEPNLFEQGVACVGFGRDWDVEEDSSDVMGAEFTDGVLADRGPEAEQDGAEGEGQAIHDGHYP